MALQIRLRHALGERTLEFAPRGPDRPISVGRAADADVQVPSVNVAPRQCVLFVHEGHWVLQDVAGAAGRSPTYVNGEPVGDYVMLQVGDTVALSNEPTPPTLEIEPDAAAEGRAGYVQAGLAGATSGTAAGATSGATSGAAAAGAGYGATGYGGAPSAGGYAPPAPGYAPSSYAAAAPPPAPSGYSAQPGESEDPSPGFDAGGPGEADDTSAWGEAAGAADEANGGSKRYYVPRGGQQTSSTAIAVGAVVGLLIIVGAALLIYNRSQQVKAPPKAAPPPPKKQDDGGARGRGSSLFVDDEDPAPAPRTTSSATTPSRDTSVRAGVTEDDDDDDNNASSGSDTASTGGSDGDSESDGEESAAGVNDTTWEGIEAAYYGNRHNQAIVRFHEYAKEHPEKASTLEKWTEEKLDAIYWERIEEVLELRKGVTDEIKEVKNAIEDETDLGYKKNELEPKRDKLLARLKRYEQELEDMGWTSDTAPPVGIEDELAPLRQKRDAAKYEKWRKRVLSTIIKRHGDLPWAMHE